MERELRKHPRVPAKLACSLFCDKADDAIAAYCFSVASRGIGVLVEADSLVPLAVGETVTVALELERMDVVGSIAWIQHAPNRSWSFGVQLHPESQNAAHYEDWVAERFAALREESLKLGGTLAGDRLITLRALQRALDDQARDGGFLSDHLSSLEHLDEQ